MGQQTHSFIDHLLLAANGRRPIDALDFSKVDIQEACRVAEDQGIAAVIYTNLENLDSLPDELVDGLRKSFENALMLREYYRSVLRELGPSLQACGRVVLLQGAALNERLYGECSVRSLSDIDLYFPDGNLHAVRKILMENGFSPLGRYQNVWCRHRLQLDLHDDLWGADRIPARKLFAPDQPAAFVPSRTIEGYYLLADPFLCLQAVMHGLKHGFSRRCWLWDLVLMQQAGIFENVKELDRAGLCTIALQHLAATGFVKSDTAPVNRKLSTLRHRLIEHSFQSAAVNGSGELLLSLCCRSWLQTLRYLVSSILPPRRVLQEMYGKHSLFKLLLLRLQALMFPRGAAVQ